jgi:hypothetical protein
MIDQKFHGRQPMRVSLSYKELGTREQFELEGDIIAHFIKTWDRDNDEERCLLNYWYAVEPFKRTHADGTVDFIEYDDLCPIAKDEITWIACTSLTA